MNWWERQIQLGWKGPVGQPRGTTEAPYPLRTGVRYRVSLNPTHGHLLMPGEDYSYCGLTLAPDETWLIESGYEEWFWIVEDERESGSWCKPCSKWKTYWMNSAFGEQKLTPSPISQDEWAATVGAEAKRNSTALDRMAATVAGWLGGQVVGDE